jgi:putative acetyltransferase
MTEDKITYKLATTPTDFEEGKQLFQEYVKSLGIDLAFQDFETELKTIDQQYNKPGGALLLALHDGKPIGCAGVRRLDVEIAELKRMYVKDEYRGLGIGVKLLEQCVQLAGELKYKRMRLDTLQSMQRARTVYEAMGFYEIPPYRFNPLEGTVYMEMQIPQKK